MQAYETEQEQIEAIKKWWKENGKVIVIGAILGFGSLIGYQKWQEGIKVGAEAASQEYNTLMVQLQQGEYQDVKDIGARVLTNFSDTSYAIMTALALAKVHVEEGNLASAKTYLQMAMDQDKLTEYQHVARLRMGRLLLAEEQAQQVLSLIGGVSASGFAASYDELRGDAYAVLGDKDNARLSYESALDAMEEGIDQSELKIKIDDLGGAEARP